MVIITSGFSKAITATMIYISSSPIRLAMPRSLVLLVPIIVAPLLRLVATVLTGAPVGLIISTTLRSVIVAVSSAIGAAAVHVSSFCAVAVIPSPVLILVLIIVSIARITVTLIIAVAIFIFK